MCQKYISVTFWNFNPGACKANLNFLLLFPRLQQTFRPYLFGNTVLTELKTSNIYMCLPRGFRIQVDSRKKNIQPNLILNAPQTIGCRHIQIWENKSRYLFFSKMQNFFIGHWWNQILWRVFSLLFWLPVCFFWLETKSSGLGSWGFLSFAAGSRTLNWPECQRTVLPKNPGII